MNKLSLKRHFRLFSTLKGSLRGKLLTSMSFIHFLSSPLYLKKEFPWKQSPLSDNKHYTDCGYRLFKRKSLDWSGILRNGLESKL